MHGSTVRKRERSRRLLSLVIAGACLAGGCRRARIVEAYELAEASTAVADVAAVSPDSLYVVNTPTLLEDDRILYSAREWDRGSVGAAVSVWASAVGGGGADELIPAEGDEALLAAKAVPGAERVFFHLDCALYSVAKTGAGGRMKHRGTGDCDYWPVPVPATGGLVFSSCAGGKDCYYGDRSVIWTVNADGTELVRLRRGRLPAVSPDGRRIAFGLDGDIWVMNRDGSEATNLTPSSDAFDTDPGFSPDGTRVVFRRERKLGEKRWDKGDLYVVALDHRAPIALTTNPAHDWGPSWGSDGFIYYVSDRGPLVEGKHPSRVWRMRLVSGEGLGAPGEPVEPVEPVGPKDERKTDEKPDEKTDALPPFLDQATATPGGIPAPPKRTALSTVGLVAGDLALLVPAVVAFTLVHESGHLAGAKLFGDPNPHLAFFRGAVAETTYDRSLLSPAGVAMTELGGMIFSRGLAELTHLTVKNIPMPQPFQRFLALVFLLGRTDFFQYAMNDFLLCKVLTCSDMDYFVTILSGDYSLATFGELNWPKVGIYAALISVGAADLFFDWKRLRRHWHVLGGKRFEDTDYAYKESPLRIELHAGPRTAFVSMGYTF